MSGDADDSMCVKVAVRIRPQLAREKIDNCRVCTSVTAGEPQVVLGNDKAFTFDKVFDIGTKQQTVFAEYAQGLIDGCLDGYNATILAYGQTGSGKTHSMGTGFDLNTTEENVGIIPRAVEYLFAGIEKCKQYSQDNALPEPTFLVLAQFMELYNEEIYDLFDPNSVSSEGGKKSKSNIKIHEDANGSIYTQGVASKQVTSYNETMECLRAGALSRTTASTNMNSQSSRSHAIFTLLIKQTRSTLQPTGDESKDVDTALGDFEVLSAKFNFVDLAGSERLKRTGATGDRAKEGISINCGLLALGNVISALGDSTKKGSHVPYRDSKLTRLLQDSLGGNSRTVMIACISPSDQDFMETLNTLKYANRAKNIKNRVVVNQDKTSKQLSELRTHIQALQVELAEYKQGKRIVGPDGVESINDMFHENSLLQVENDKLRRRVKTLQETVDSLTSRNASMANDRAAVILSGLTGDNMNEEVQKLIAGYTSEIEGLRTKLLESEANIHTISKTTARTPTRLGSSMSRSSMNTPVMAAGVSTPVAMSVDSTMSIIELAKRDVEKSRRALVSRQESVAGNDETGVSVAADSGAGDSGVTSGGGVDSGGGSGVDEDSGEHEDGDLGMDEQTDEEGEDEEEELGGDEELSSDSDESDQESNQLQEDLAELSGEISLKQRMIEELEKSQRQLQNIRQHYEDKLRNLQDQIKAIERERDQVLNSLGSKKQKSDEQVKKVKSEYEKKISTMQSELSKVNAAKKEHAKMMKNQAVYDKRIKDLSVELNEMKKIKVRLMAQMKTESEKSKLNDQKKSKELLQLRKEKRLRENQVKMLELQNRQKDAILKRKHEEVSLLRKKQRENTASQRVLAKNRVNSAQHGTNSTVSNRTNTTKPGAVRKNNSKENKTPTAPFSPKLAKSKWDKLEHYISSVVMRKQTISSMEAEMDLHICKREELSKKIENYSKRLDVAINRDQTEVAMDLEDQLESMMVNMNYIQSNVTDCQNSIMQMEEEAKDETSLSTVMNTSSLQESKYLLEHLLSLALSRGFDCTQKEAQYKELCARYEKIQLDTKLRDQLLDQVLKDSGITLQSHMDYDGAGDNLSGDNSSSCRSSPLSGELTGSADEQMWAEMSKFGVKNRKARRRTATTQELLMGISDTESLPTPTQSNNTSPTSGKPSINIADILPPAPKGPPPGRGLGPPPIDTILEEEEIEASTAVAVDSQNENDLNVMIRSGSYTVLNPTMAEKPDIVNSNGQTNGDASNSGQETNSEAYTTSGSNSPDNELNLIENKRLLAGSYTILNGDITLDNSTQAASTEEGKKIPPKVPPKPTRPSGLDINAGPITGSVGMNKWKGVVVSSHLDNVSMSPLDSPVKGSDGKPPLSTQTSSGDLMKDSSGRVIGRRKLAPGSSPSLRRKTFQSSNSRGELKDIRQTPPSSPTLSKRRPFDTAASENSSSIAGSAVSSSGGSNNSNVFMRLTGGGTTQTSTRKSKSPGTIQACEKVNSSGLTMICTKRAVGHTKAVLSVCATEQLMISGSKDLTCKVWDLSIGAELMSLGDHPNYVTTVRYCDVNKLVYTVSNSFVKIWDIRSGAKCVKVLSSSGLVHDSIPIEPASSSQAILQQGEQQIFDIRLSSDGQTLYTTTGTTVRVWDLRMYSAVGKVATGHQAPLICLSLHNSKHGGENLITGSKDHLIKLFDLSSEQTSSCLMQPKFTLDPPHYDGVQCLAHRGNTLFSGSRDMCIKKWDLSDPSLQPLSLNAAHKDWILDLGMMPDNDVLISCCRSGTVKLWASESCTQLDEVKAHSSAVNCLATNSRNLFTASSDCTVKIWSVDSQRLAGSS